MHALRRILSSLSFVGTGEEETTPTNGPSAPATSSTAHADSQESAPITTASITALPATVLERLAVHIRFNSDRATCAKDQDALAALAMTCWHICNAVTPILYKSPVLNRLQALTLLESTLNDRPDLAARVKRLALSPTFADIPSLDVIGLIMPAKWRDNGSVPSIALFEEQGPTAARMLFMSWMTHFVTICPELKHIDWSLATDIPPQYAFGFTNLATLLRERGGSFQAPAQVDWPVSCIRATDPDHPRISVIYFVNSLDYGNRTLDIHNVMEPRYLMTYNLAPIDDLIVGGPAEMKRWKIRNVNLADQHQDDPFIAFESQLPMSSLEAFGLPLHAHILELNKQRVPPSSLSVGTTVFVSSCGPCDVHDILNRRGYATSQCTGLKLSLPPYSPSAAEEQEPMLVRLVQDLFKTNAMGLDRMCSLPLVSVRALTLGTPYFAFASSAASLTSLHKFATGLPSLESLVIHSACTSIADILLSLDPLLRRATNRLQELTIMRTSVHTARREITLPPSLPLNSPYSTNSTLRLDQARAGHLRQLILFDPKPTETVAIHPGLLLGIERLNVRGVRLLVAPHHLASATGPSFPYPASLLTAHSGRHPNLFTSMTLPNLRSLAINADRELQAAADDPDIDNLDQLLPTCPRLESLVLTATHEEYFTRAGFVLDVIDKYAGSLRNVGIMHTLLSDAQLDKLGVQLAKRVHEWRVRRVLLANRKPVKESDPDLPFADRLATDFDKERLLAFGDLATTCASHVLVPADRAATATLTFRPPSTLSRHPGYVKHEQAVRTKGSRPGTPCVCGKVVMGRKKGELGTKVWVTPTGLDVVCEECVVGKVKPAQVWDMSEWEGGRGGRIEMREVKHLRAGQGKHVDIQIHMSHGVWGVGDRSVLGGVTWLE